MLMTFAVLLFLAPGTAIDDSSCTCRAASATEVPHVTASDPRFPDLCLRIVRGMIVVSKNVPAADIVVEVYMLERPQRDSASAGDGRSPTRIAACVTGADGRYCFPNLEAGSYLLVIGPQGKREVTAIQVQVELNPRGPLCALNTTFELPRPLDDFEDDAEPGARPLGGSVTPVARRRPNIGVAIRRPN